MSTVEEIRVGVIGTGFGQKVVARAFEATDGCSVTDVVSPRDAEAVRQLCGRSDLDLVSVHSPPFMHMEHVRLALEAGHSVLCDKPFGCDSIEARAMRDLAAAAGTAHLINFEMRYDGTRQRIRRLVLEGAVGRPEHVVVSAHLALSRQPLRSYGWLFDADRGGGWIGAWGSHLIDFLRWTFGEMIESSAVARTAVAERPDADGHLHRCSAEDGFTASLRTKSGVTVCIDSSFAASVNTGSYLAVFGSDGALEVAGEQDLVLRRPDGSEEVVAVEGSGIGASMRTMAAVARDSVRTAAVPADAPTFDDGLACRIVMDALLGRSGLGPLDSEYI
ncbi:MAG: Gfo/Idh/MocA family oxidoreductase [Actinomycetota bacterium]|nr:Gfo/Idh/MocA family oxidoreductase [Actinomycetota bacterium]